MAYRSESDFQLEIIDHLDSVRIDGSGSVFLFHYSTQRSHGQNICANYFTDKYSEFADSLPDDSIVCFLLDSLAACDLISQLQGKLHYRLWVAIERSEPLPKEGQLPDNHVALVVFTKHSKSFKHCRIQIQYTICPACGKTTKDYGGKKHLYSPYGTLMSDVWRDIKYFENKYPEDVLKRLSALFAVEPYVRLYYYDYRNRSDIFCRSEAVKKENSLHTVSEIAIESQLINDDCIKVLRNLPENFVDFAFADPPYNIKKKYDNWHDDIHIEEYFSWCDDWIEGIYRALKPGRTFALINIPLWIVRHYLFAKNIFRFQDLIVWEGLGLPVRNIMPAHYGIICLSKGYPRSISNYENKLSPEKPINTSQSLKEWYCLRQPCIRRRNLLEIIDKEPITNLWWDIHRLKHNSKRVDHPTQLPPELMKRLIFTFTKEKEIVMDPFNGAGTTSLVADLMGRKYIGIELSENYHKIASNRHLEIMCGENPFRKQNSTPRAKNSRVQRLRKQKYKVSKKTLQLEVRDIANKLGRKPTRDDVKENTKFPFQYFEDYFIDWGEVCAAVGDKGMNEDPKESSPNPWERRALFEHQVK